MNFFAHFEVARALSVSRSAALGAMLPDLLPMCGAKLAEPTGRELARGVALHHRTDAVFHLADGFVRQTSEARQSLAALGLRRGPALAVAHVGVELQLDGWLAKEHDPADLFEVLRSPGDIWADGDSARRFAQLVERLARLGIPSTVRRPGELRGRTAAHAGLPPSPCARRGRTGERSLMARPNRAPRFHVGAPPVRRRCGSPQRRELARALHFVVPRRWSQRSKD